MDVTLSAVQEGDHCNLRIGGELCIFDVRELKQSLLGYLKQSRGMSIDLADVREIDCAGFQLLYLLKREALAEGKKVSLVNHSQAVLEMLGLLNMEAYFGDPLVLAS
jgi:anti-sigma B factor antagonist